jgi:hypothetical protein
MGADQGFTVGAKGRVLRDVPQLLRVVLSYIVFVVLEMCNLSSSSLSWSVL